KRNKNIQSLDPIPMDVLFEILLMLHVQQHPRLLLASDEQIKRNQEPWYFFSKSTLVFTPLYSVSKREPNQLVSVDEYKALVLDDS
ncbi:unnamed protein product, partial [Thlaspi arvense]